ncbi:HAD family hydrolase [Streptomyces sp. AJS327]|uniref:HAD family hydrolase n=1 Tax=Streptomyces sp. AJS327 TaxID=2545265 RepID=UPI0015DFAB65|nr:HAD family hydrolase [Streptomyces sp. AJS327]MBA0053852.1 HAD family hydrolase [Streptomyces sp. AJS327]
MRYDLVILDNDGVLVDSEPLSNRILAAYLTELGHPTTYEEAVRDYMGSAVHRIHDLVLERSGRRLPDDFDRVFHERVFAAFRRELEPVDGAPELLEKLVADATPFCVASSGSHERIRVALRKTGLYEQVGSGRIFSADDVGQGKPAPDLFLRAAGAMGVEPGRCAVVEDSPAGVRAARLAGMDVFGYAALTPRARLGEATEVFTSMGELTGLLSG